MKTLFDHFECEGCGWIYTVVEMEDMRADYRCPRCGIAASQSTFIEARREERNNHN
jgi:rubredoxin